MDKDNNMKILLAEDEGILRFFLKNFLKKDDSIELIEAFDGAEALKKFKENENISIIITDIKMPNMNGMEFIKKVREIDSDVPIIIESGLREEEFDDVKDVVNGVVKKPIEPSDIINLIRKYS